MRIVLLTPVLLCICAFASELTNRSRAYMTAMTRTFAISRSNFAFYGSIALAIVVLLIGLATVSLGLHWVLARAVAAASAA